MIATFARGSLKLENCIIPPFFWFFIKMSNAASSEQPKTCSYGLIGPKSPPRGLTMPLRDPCQRGGALIGDEGRETCSECPMQALLAPDMLVTPQDRLWRAQDSV